MATLHPGLSLTNVNTKTTAWAILLALFLTIVTAGQAFSDGGHAGPSVSGVEIPRGCGTRESALKVLAQHGETRQSAAVAKTGQFIELFANLETGTWTFVITPRPGVSCFGWYGDNWRTSSEPAGDSS